MGLAKAQEYKQTRAWVWARNTPLGKWVRACRRCRRELWAWTCCERVTFPKVKELTESIEALGASLPLDAKADPEAPIFLLSTGWRAGSTLLQRILVTDPSLLLWGEPLGEMALASRITEIIKNSLSPRNLEIWRRQGNLTSSSLATSWIANLYPGGSDFRSALRSLFDRWLQEPACQSGFTRWGFKEVRYGSSEAALLHWLYPQAKFVIISRHPYDCYRSMSDSGWPLYYQYPDVQVNSAVRFARYWNALALSWTELPEGFPCFHIQYEDLISGKVDFRKLESWLGLEIRENLALSASVGGTAKRSQLSWHERMIIAHEAEAGMKTLGYSK
jgi:Sulfotransferase family